MQRDPFFKAMGLQIVFHSHLLNQWPSHVLTCNGRLTQGSCAPCYAGKGCLVGGRPKEEDDDAAMFLDCGTGLTGKNQWACCMGAGMGVIGCWHGWHWRELSYPSSKTWPWDVATPRPSIELLQVSKMLAKLWWATSRSCWSVTSVSNKMIHTSSAPSSAGVPRHWQAWCGVFGHIVGLHLVGVANEGGHGPIVLKFVRAQVDVPKIVIEWHRPCCREVACCSSMMMVGSGELGNMEGIQSEKLNIT